MLLKLFALSLLAVSAAGGGQPSFRWVDLTYALNKDTVLFPGRKMLFGVEFEGELPDGSWIASRGFCISEHTSTHVDAPYHFYKNGKTLSEIPLETFLDIPGVCVDIYDKVHRFENGHLSVISNYVLTREDLLEWESKNGPIPAGSMVLVRTGWGNRWPNAADYMGIPEDKRNSTDTNFIGDPSKPYEFRVDVEGEHNLNFPGFDASAATFLSTERNVNGVGIDALSLDAGNSKTFIAHKIFTKNGVFMIENAANLHLLPPRGFQIYAVPFKVDKGTGSPTRLLAKFPVQ